MNRNAYLIGINYNAVPSKKLAGCINDAKNMQRELAIRGYTTVVATDEITETKTRKRGCCSHPVVAYEEAWASTTTRSAILNGIKQILDKNGTIVVSYSGHGSSIADQSGDENDGRDEVLCPWDGEITDDELSKLLEGFKGTLFFLLDCCHSGTLLDLPVLFDTELTTVQCTGPDRPYRVVTLSGCRDDQTSSDTENVEGVQGPTGALTACFLASLHVLPSNTTLKVLAFDVRRRLQTAGFKQTCQLAASQSALLNLPLSYFF